MAEVKRLTGTFSEKAKKLTYIIFRDCAEYFYDLTAPAAQDIAFLLCIFIACSA